MEQTTNKINSIKHNIENLISNHFPVENIAEQKVLGSLIANPENIFTILNMLTINSFCNKVHKEIFFTLITLAIEHNTINIDSVFNKLIKNKKLDIIGGIEYLKDLSNNYSEVSNIKTYANTVQQRQVRIELISCLLESLVLSFNKSFNSEDLIIYIEHNLKQLSNSINS